MTGLSAIFGAAPTAALASDRTPPAAATPFGSADGPDSAAEARSEGDGPTTAPATSAFLALLLGQISPPPVPASGDALKMTTEKAEKGREAEVEASGVGFGASVLVSRSAAVEGAVSAIEPAPAAEPSKANAAAEPESARSQEPGGDDGLGLERIESSRIPGRDAVRIDLRPEGQGAVSLRLALRNGDVTGVILASREATAAALRPEIERARATLAAAGVSVAALVVAVRSAATGAGAVGEDEPGGDWDEGASVAPIDGRSKRRRRTRFDFTV